MRAVVQRVTNARVEIDHSIVGAIDHGLLIFLGIERNDQDEDLQWLVQKIAQQRIFSDDQGKMNRSCADCGGSFLVVSQFTLLASTVKGNRPSFTPAEAPDIAETLYLQFCQCLREITPCPVATGRFAADMQVHLLNDGPVTFILDSRLRW
jgi:D-aminoacyl-tRNA deacylase